MKRFLSVLLILCLLLPLAACGEKPAPAEPVQPTVEPTPAPAEPTPAEPEPAPAPAPEPEPEPVKTEYTREELQELVQEAAMAFYYHNPDYQYDSIVLADGFKHMSNGDLPEQASYDMPLYSVCSNFCYEVYNAVFGKNLVGYTKSSATKNLASMPLTDPRVVYKFGGEGGETDISKAMKEARAVLEPGDLIVGYGDTGHAMVYVGDVLGDGIGYVAHCWGRGGDLTTGVDKYEADGSIKLQNVDDLCFKDGPSPNWYLAEPAHGTNFTVLRLLNTENMKFEPTASAVARVKYKRITIFRNLDRYMYDGIISGEEIPVTVTVQNNGKEDFKAVPVTENLPEGQTLVSGSASAGASVEGSTIKWTVDVPAGKSVDLTYKVKVTGSLGQTVLFPAGDVGGIASREIEMVIGGTPLTDEQGIKFALITLDSLPAELKKPTEFLDLDFANKVYQAVLGVDPKIPATVKEFTENVLQRKNALGTEIRVLTKLAKPKAGYETAWNMVIPKHVTGYYVLTNANTHGYITTYHEEFYQPGDVFYVLSGENSTTVLNDRDMEIFIYLGGNRVLTYSKQNGVAVSSYDKTIALGIKYNLVVGLRPTLAYDNLVK